MELSHASHDIDAAAKEVIDYHTSSIIGPQFIFLEKYNQAMQYKNAGYSGSCPYFVQVYSEIFGLTTQQAADKILTDKASLIAMIGPVEKLRLQAQIAVQNASSGAERFQLTEQFTRDILALK